MLFALAIMFEQVICCAVDSVALAIGLCWDGDFVALAFLLCPFCVFEGRVSAKSVFEECLAGVSAHSVSQTFFPRVSSRSVSKSVVAILSSSDVFHACLAKRVFPRLSFQECSPHVVASGSRKILPPVLSPPSCCLLFFLLRGIQVRGTLHIIGMVVCWFVARSYHMWFLLCSRVHKLRIRTPFEVGSR